MLYALSPAVCSFFGDGTVLIIAGMVVMVLGVDHALGGPGPQARTVLAQSTATRHAAIARIIAVAGGEQARPVRAAILLCLLLAALVSVPDVVWRKRASGNGRTSIPALLGGPR